MVFSRFYLVAFAENASFKIEFRRHLLPGELSMDKRGSNGFFSTQKVCMAIDPTRRLADH
jgi:hypothetical protein